MQYIHQTKHLRRRPLLTTTTNYRTMLMTLTLAGIQLANCSVISWRKNEFRIARCQAVVCGVCMYDIVCII